VAKTPPSNARAAAWSPSSSAVVNDRPLAWKMRPSSIAPHWLMRPSAGISSARGSGSGARAPARNARVKKALKLSYAAGSDSAASSRSTPKRRTTVSIGQRGTRGWREYASRRASEDSTRCGNAWVRAVSGSMRSVAGGERGEVGGDRPGIQRRLQHTGHASLRIEHGHRSGVVDAVLVGRRAFRRRHLHEHQRQRAREVLERGDVGGRGKGVAVERVRVLADAVGGVALGVDGYEQDPRAGGVGQRLPLALRLRQLRQRRRADVRAMGEAQEHDGPVATELAGHERGAVGLAQAEGGELARGLE